MVKSDHLKKISFIAASIQAYAALWTADKLIFRIFQLQRFHKLSSVDIPRMEQKLMGRNGEQRLGILLNLREKEVVDVLTGNDKAGSAFTVSFHDVSNILDGSEIPEEQIEFINCCHSIPLIQQLTGHIGEDIEQHSAAKPFISIQEALDSKAEEIIIGNIGMAVKVFTFAADAHGVKSQAYILKRFFRIKMLA